MQKNNRFEFVYFDREDLENISKDKQCFQSSISRWSKKNDPIRAIQNIEYNDYLFHTDPCHENPWWMLDLNKVESIDCIEINNRKNKKYIDRIKNLIIEISIDGLFWTKIASDLCKLTSSDNMEVLLYGKVKARYIKISLKGKYALALGNIFVFKRKIPGLIIAARNDGIGGRLLAIIHALVLSNILKYKFRYFWKDATTWKHLENLTNCEGNNLAGQNTGDDRDIFSSCFIDKYSRAFFDSKAPLSIKNNKDLIKLENFDNISEGWGVFSPLLPLSDQFEMFDADKYKKMSIDAFKRIGFNDNVKTMFKKVDKTTKKLGNFFSIHIRGAEIVYGPEKHRQNIWINKVMPIEFVLHIVMQHSNDKIVLFSDDITLIALLKKRYNNVLIASEFDDEYINYKPSVKSLYEIYLMSKSKKIYRADSSIFSRFALLISKNVEAVNIYSYYSIEEQLEILNKFVIQNDFTPSIRLAFTYYLLYFLHNKNGVIKNEYIEKAMSIDSTNLLYKIVYIGILVKKADFETLENFLKSECLENIAKQIIDKSYVGFTYKSELDLILKADFKLNIYSNNLKFLIKNNLES